MTGLEVVAALEIMSLGIDVVSKALHFYNEVQGESNRQAEEVQGLRTLLASSTESLKKAIQIGSETVIQKLEQDKMEELESRLKNLDMLLRMKKQDQLLNYVLQVQESVDYAKNRLDEGKEHWFMPYITGRSMVAATFAFLGDEDPETTEELRRVMEEAKRKILDEAAAALVKAGQKIPWDVVYGLLDGREGSVAELIGMLPLAVVNSSPSNVCLTLTITTLPVNVDYPGLLRLIWSLGHPDINSGVKLKNQIPFDISKKLSGEEAHHIQNKLNELGVSYLLQENG